MKKRGQAAVESMLIIAIILIVLISILTFRDDVMTGVTSSYHSAKIKILSDKIVQAATLVYQQGEGARTTIFVTMPSEVKNITFTGNLIVINMNISGVLDSSYKKTDFKLNGSIPTQSGNLCLLLQSGAGFVEVSNFNGTC